MILIWTFRTVALRALSVLTVPVASILSRDAFTAETAYAHEPWPSVSDPVPMNDEAVTSFWRAISAQVLARALASWDSASVADVSVALTLRRSNDAEIATPMAARISTERSTAKPASLFLEKFFIKTFFIGIFFG